MLGGGGDNILVADVVLGGGGDDIHVVYLV